MSDSSETFFTSVGCMDGRVQKVIAEYGKEKLGADYPDTITEAGLVGKLAKEGVWEDLKFKVVTVSIEKHHSKGIIVHGHQQCAGNPVDDEKHKEDILKSAEIIRQFVPEDTEVLPVFVVKNTTWEVEPL